MFLKQNLVFLRPKSSVSVTQTSVSETKSTVSETKSNVSGTPQKHYIWFQRH